MDYQFHFGKKFYLDKKTGYWISTTMPKIRAHVWVWESFNNEKVPKGFHVHHVDGNKSNNDISNLLLMHPKQHVNHHFTDERREKARKHVNNIRSLTKAWHASEEGKAWHKFHGLRTWKERESFIIKCKVCSKEAITKTFHQDFCSNACKSKWRRDQKIDHEERECTKCKKMFRCGKYAKNTTCGRSCAAKMRWKSKVPS